MPRIEQLTVRPLDAALREPFGIATGRQTAVANLLVELRTSDGVLGYGEAAPLPAVNGETRDQAARALESARPKLVGLELETWRETAARAQTLLPAPSALAAFETALLDALTRTRHQSLFDFFGGAEPELESDITLTTGTPVRAAEQAASARARGFRTLKVKVGGAPPAHDLERLARAAEAFPEAAFLLDANASLDAGQALALLDGMGALRERVVLFEQPTPKHDLAALARVRKHAGVPIAADESVASAADVARLADAGAVDVINLKIMKAGVVAAHDAALEAKRQGLGLMIGGMVETRLAMTASACLAGGLGGFRFVDLDTPLFLAEDPVVGGFEERWPILSLSRLGLGHGVRPRTMLG